MGPDGYAGTRGTTTGGSCVDLVQLSAFLRATQPKVADALDLGSDSPTRRQFLARLQGQISKRGTIDVIRQGVKDGPHHIDVFYWDAVAGEREGAAVVPAEPLQRDAAAALQPGRDGAGPGPWPVHQRPADRDPSN